MDLDYSNDMINSSTDRMTTEHWVNIFGTFLSYSLGIMLGKVGGILKSGCGRRCTFSMGNYFPHDIIIYPTRLYNRNFFHDLHFFAA